jgi:cytochrome c oxidase assembly protein subunit 15
MSVTRVTPAGYRRLTTAALVMTTVIIVTGAAVRLTGSGLGCSDWPKCTQNDFFPSARFHGLVEFVNRAFTGVMGVALIIAILASTRRVPRRRDLTWLSVGLAFGVVGQALVGALVVKTDLNPAAVILHFLLSVVMVFVGMVLHRRAGEPPGPYQPTVAPALRTHAWVVLALASAAVAAGTIVTGTGPHGGDERAHRFPFEITTVARVHSALVWTLLAATIALAARARRGEAWTVLRVPIQWLLATACVQGLIGYVQYALDVPPGLVAVHIAGSVAVFVTATHLALVTRRATGHEAPAAATATRVAVAPA